MEDKLPSGRGGMANPLSTAFDSARCGCPFTMPWKKLRDFWSREPFSSSQMETEVRSPCSLRSEGYLKAAAVCQLISKTSEFRAEEYKAFEAQSVTKLQTRMAGMYDNPVKEMRFIRCSWP